jgi:predicted Zn-dependent protease
MKKSLLILLLLGFGFAGGADSHAAEAEDLNRMREFMSIMEGYYAIIDGVHAVSSDKEKSAILQLQKIEEIYKKRGDRAEAINVLRDVVKRTSNETVRNAAAVMLADALNETGQASEAVEVLRTALERNL